MAKHECVQIPATLPYTPKPQCLNLGLPWNSVVLECSQERIELLTESGGREALVLPRELKEMHWFLARELRQERGPGSGLQATHHKAL